MHERTVYAAYRKMCAGLDLLSDVNEERKAIQHSSISSFVPPANVFVTIIGRCYATDLAQPQIFSDSKRILIDDIRNRLRPRILIER